MTAYLLEHAWLGTPSASPGPVPGPAPGVATDVLVRVADGRFTAVEPGGPPPPPPAGRPPPPPPPPLPGGAPEPPRFLRREGAQFRERSSWTLPGECLQLEVLHDGAAFLATRWALPR